MAFTHLLTRPPQKASIEETKRLINKNIVKADDWDVKWDKIEHIRENREYDLKDRLDIIQPVYDTLMKKGHYKKAASFAKKYGL